MTRIVSWRPCLETAVVMWLGLGVAAACYLYPEGVVDPCAGRQCSYGAGCRPSLDGLTARCQCPDHCDQYGDTVDAGERCGDDGHDYSSDCAMRLTACRELREIRTKYEGRCGQYDSQIIITATCFRFRYCQPFLIVSV